MLDGPKDVDRKVIPRWRSLLRTSKIEFQALQPLGSRPDGLLLEAAEVTKAWQQQRTLPHAMELISLRPLVGDTAEIFDAASLILNSSSAPHPLKQMAARILIKEEDHVEERSTKEGIKRWRQLVRENPRNVFAHVELAREWSSIGEADKAAKTFKVALSLAPANRFVLRSATRFLVHQGKLDGAWAMLRDQAKTDPWIAAALISVAQMGKLPTPKFRDIENLIEVVDNPHHTTELSAALATLELEAGSMKRARRLFKESSKAPNDNVVAQLEWASKHHGIVFDRSLLAQDLAYEAQAADRIEAEDWNAAVAACELWLKDEPFSSRPAYEGSFVAGELMDDPARAVNFVKRGLIANPHDSGLYNNLAFFQAAKGDLKEALINISTARKHAPDAESLVPITATLGFIEYRTGNSEGGAKLYLEAIDQAKKLKMQSSVQLGYIHLLAEEIRFGHNVVTNEELGKLRSLFSDAKVEPIIKAIFRKSIEKPLLERQERDSVQVALQDVFSQTMELLKL